MKIIRLYEMTRADTQDPLNHEMAIRQILAGRPIVACGVAEFAPGLCAHEGEKHVHEYDELFIILAGEITVPITGGPTERARAGDCAFVAAGEEHHLTNHTSLPAVALYILVGPPKESP